MLNSGSPAKLVAFYSLTSPKLEDKTLRLGNEVITIAAGFPIMFNPLIPLGCIPVFIDIDILTFNIKAEMINTHQPQNLGDQDNPFTWVFHY